VYRRASLLLLLPRRRRVRVLRLSKSVRQTRKKLAPEESAMFVNFGSLPIQSGYFDATLYVGVMKLPADCSYRKLLTGYIARTTWCFLLAPNPTFNSHRTLGMYVRDDDIKLLLNYAQCRIVSSSPDRR
jgi:hypothetical protein